MKKLVFIMMGIFISAGITFTAKGTAQAGESPEIKTAVMLDQSTYNPEDEINISLRIANEGDVDVITSKGFSATVFSLMLRFIDDQGNVIATNSIIDEAQGVTPEPPLLFSDESVQGELVEFLYAENSGVESKWSLDFPTFDARDFYPLEGRSGHFTVQAVIPMTTYPRSDVQCDEYDQSEDCIECEDCKKYAALGSADWHGAIESNIASFTLIGDNDGDGYYYPEPLPGGSQQLVDCDDSNPAIHPFADEIPSNGIDDDCNLATPDVLGDNYGVIALKVYKHTVGSGTHPGSEKDPMGDLPVRIYDKSAGSCVSGIGVSWQHYQTVWETCTFPSRIGNTSSDGTIELPVLPGDYIIIARHDPDDPAIDDGDEIYLGVSVGAVESGDIVQKYLQMIVKSNGKKVPAKYTRRGGSELLIIEPEYIEWDGTQEEYPFIFDSIGDWTVSTSVSPPEGFVADNATLSEEVISEVEAVQFTISDIGSEWVSTGVVHTVKHKKKTEKIKSKIGIKLSKRLAKKKGLGIYGKEEKEARQEGHKADQKEKQKDYKQNKED